MRGTPSLIEKEGELNQVIAPRVRDTIPERVNGGVKTFHWGGEISQPAHRR